MSTESSQDVQRSTFPAKGLENGEAWSLVTRSPEETQEAGRKFAGRLESPCVILLEGELGAGKTTLIKGIVEGLGAAQAEDVTSPTFALIHEYGAGRVYHIDLYRVETVAELESLGLDDIVGGNGVVLVEWGEKLEARLEGQAIRIRLEYVGDNRRKITVEGAAGRP